MITWSWDLSPLYFPAGSYPARGFLFFSAIFLPSALRSKLSACAADALAFCAAERVAYAELIKSAAESCDFLLIRRPESEVRHRIPWNEVHEDIKATAERGQIIGAPG